MCTSYETTQEPARGHNVSTKDCRRIFSFTGLHKVKEDEYLMEIAPDGSSVVATVTNGDWDYFADHIFIFFNKNAWTL